jgi:hypothetical protein
MGWISRGFSVFWWHGGWLKTDGRVWTRKSGQVARSLTWPARLPTTLVSVVLSQVQRWKNWRWESPLQREAKNLAYQF